MNINTLYAHEAVKEFERRDRALRKKRKLPAIGRLKCQNCPAHCDPRTRLCDDCFTLFAKY